LVAKNRLISQGSLSIHEFNTMQSIRDTIVKATVLLTVLQVLTMVTGLLKQSLIAAYFGTSATMDAYVVALTAIGLIQVLTSRPIRQCLIPMFRHDLAQRGENVAWAGVSILLNNLVAILVTIVLLGWLLAPYLVTLVAPGLEKAAASLAAALARITIPSVIFLALGTLLSQILFTYQRFSLPGLVGSVNNLVIIVVLVAFASTQGIYALAAGMVLGAFSQFVLQFPILWKNRRLYSLTVNLRHPGTIEMGKLSFPVVISAGGKELARFTDRIFASLLPVGSLSSLSFAYAIISFLQTFFIGPAQDSTFPHFTKLSAEEKFATLSRQLFKYIRIAFFITLPIAIGAMLLSENIVKVVFQRGAFDETSVRMTSTALTFYAIGFPATAMSAILNRTFFGLKDTWTPTKIALFSIGIKIVLCWPLIGMLAHAGIALADSIAQIASALLLFFFLPEEVKRQEGWNTFKSVGQTLTAAILMGAVIYLPKGTLKGLLNVPLELAALIFAGGAAYGAIAFIIQRQELQLLVNSVTASIFRSLSSKR
jgi:putative peptidoglycan lipid II flippase